LTEPFVVTVDNTAPTVAISAPAAAATVSGTPVISGTVTDTNFEAPFLVEYGVGSSPNTWVLITAGQQSVTSGQLAMWDARWLQNGAYTLRVTNVDKAGNQTIVQRQVTLDNIQITGVSASPQFFTPGNGSTTIDYSLDRAANVTIEIYELNFTSPEGLSLFDVFPQLVATPISNQSKGVGVNSSTWDGRDDLSALLPFKAYSYAITATTASPPRQGYYNPQYAKGDTQLTNRTGPSSYDPYKSQAVQLGYSIPSPAWVNLKVIEDLPEGVTLRDLLTWVPQNSGAHQVSWDGRASNGTIVTGQNKTKGFAQLLPLNAVVTEPRSNAITALSCEPYLFRPVYSELTHIGYTIVAAAKVAIKVYDPGGSLFATLQNDVTPRAAGNYSLQWAGTNAAGLRAYMDGSYRVEVTSTGVDNDTVTRSGTVTIDR
jgi:flagellar hook assembly protein FlgD